MAPEANYKPEGGGMRRMYYRSPGRRSGFTLAQAKMAALLAKEGKISLFLTANSASAAHFGKLASEECRAISAPRKLIKVRVLKRPNLTKEVK